MRAELQHHQIVDTGESPTAHTAADDRGTELACDATQIRKVRIGAQSDDQLARRVHRIIPMGTIVVPVTRGISEPAGNGSETGGAGTARLSSGRHGTDGRKCAAKCDDGDQTTNQRWNLPAIGVLP